MKITTRNTESLTRKAIDAIDLARQIIDHQAALLSALHQPEMLTTERRRDFTIMGTIVAADEYLATVDKVRAELLVAREVADAPHTLVVEPTTKDARGGRRFEIRERQEGGFRLHLLLNGQEHGGGVFEDESEALEEGQSWLDGAQAENQPQQVSWVDMSDLEAALYAVRGAALGLSFGVSSGASEKSFDLLCCTMNQASDRAWKAFESVLATRRATREFDRRTCPVKVAA